MVGRLRDPAAAAVGLSERRTRMDKHGHYGEADEDSYELARLKPWSTVSRQLAVFANCGSYVFGSAVTVTST